MLDNCAEPNNPNERIRASCERVMEAYALLGYPQQLLGQWALPERDAIALIAGVEECSPLKILEVGTYVGVTTQLTALHTPPEAHIHTVDPNFPLHVEMLATRSNLYDSDAEIRTQDLGRKVAESLGVQDKISFHQGGFSVGSTFASNNTDPLARVEIVGPEICEKYGPFDFIFVDGLHYEEAVFSDLMLASRHLADGGLLAMHDVKGRWGSNIRRAVFRFLRERDDFIFYHSPFTVLHTAVGFLCSRKTAPSRSSWIVEGRPDTQGIVQESILSNLSSTIVEIFSPRRVLQFYAEGLDLSSHLMERGVAVVRTVSPGTIVDKDYEAHHDQSLEQGSDADKYDLCICLGLADKLDPAAADDLIRACTEASDRVVFATTPPGELGKWYPNLRPISYWAEKFFARGFVPRDLIRPRLEPLTYIDPFFSDYKITSSYLLNTYLMEKQSPVAGVGDSAEANEMSLLARESRIEDLVLQHFYQTLVIDDARRQLQSMREDLNQTRGEVVEGRNRLTDAQQELGSLQQELEKARRSLYEAKNELRSVRREFQIARRQLQRAREESARIARERARELEKSLTERLRRAASKVAELIGRANSSSSG